MRSRSKINAIRVSAGLGIGALVLGVTLGLPGLLLGALLGAVLGGLLFGLLAKSATERRPEHFTRDAPDALRDERARRPTR